MTKRKQHEKRVQQRERLKESTGAEERIEAEREQQERAGTERLAQEPEAKHHEAHLPAHPQR